jgi:hypothetical protein
LHRRWQLLVHASTIALVSPYVAAMPHRGDRRFPESRLVVVQTVSVYFVVFATAYEATAGRLLDLQLGSCCSAFSDSPRTTQLQLPASD